MSTIIYHNPSCGTSRNVLGLIRNSSVEPTVIEYLKTPTSRETLKELVAAMAVPVLEVLRIKGTPYEELALGGGLGRAGIAASANLGQPVLRHDAGLFDRSTLYRPKAGLRRSPAFRLVQHVEALLDSSADGVDFRKLFNIRSAYLYGRLVSPLSTSTQVKGQRLARRVVMALVDAALAAYGSVDREHFLQNL